MECVYDGRTDSKEKKAPKDWEEGETRETWGRSALVLTDSSPRLLSRDSDHFALPPPCRTIFGSHRFVVKGPQNEWLIFG